MTLPFDDYMTAIEAATRSLADAAAEAGPATRVPTCPDWTVTDLVGHQGRVHRWATLIATGGRETMELPPDAEAATRPPTDPARTAAWFEEGAAALIAALTAAPDDLTAPVFLHAAPPAKMFWARRQAHETSIHAVDALAARLGRVPTTAEADIPPDLAADGIDELLIGFVGRRSSRLRSDRPFTLRIAPTDRAEAWTVDVSSERPAPRRASDGPADVTLTGSAAGLYLALWNRGGDVETSGHDEVLGLWREAVQINWA